MIFLDAHQIDRLSNIFDNAGQVALGAFIFSQIANGFDSTKILVIVSGIGTVLLCWVTSLWLARSKKEFI